jgi:hypothetical protein
MHNNPPYPAYYPAKFDLSGYNYNPQGSLPGPVPKVYTMPGIWRGSTVALQNRFTAGTAPVVRTVTWSTPIYDLRPEFKGSINTVTAQQTNVGVVPVWRQLFGVGGKLWVQLSGFDRDAFSKTGLNVTVTEFGDILDPLQVTQLSDADDVTANFTGLAPKGLACVVPPGDGYPIRYWRAAVTINYMVDNGADPNIALLGAYY